MDFNAPLPIDSGFAAFLGLLFVGFLATEPWRWAGVVVGVRLPLDSEALVWIRAVSTALVAGLVTRIVFFAPGDLGNVPLLYRLLAFTIAIVIFFAAKRNFPLGVFGGAITLAIVQLMSASTS